MCFDHDYESPSPNPAAGIARETLRRCIHCGLCTSSCPTFTELGDENDGPRGRIQLMRQVAEGSLPLTGRVREHLELCLDCRACETACPSGVEYGRIVEPFRTAMLAADRRWEQRFDWFRELILLRLFPYPERLRVMLGPVRMSQRWGLFDIVRRLGLLKLLPERLARMTELLPDPAPGTPRLPRFSPAVGRKRARVALFVGCVADVMFRHVHWATIRVLQHNGCDVFVPRGQGCCGAIHLHCGDALGARRLADQNLVAFELDRYDAIVVNHGGCGAMLREYGVHWRDGLQPHRKKFAAKVVDVHEFIEQLGMTLPAGRIDAAVTYHDSCHLAHAQRVTAAPRQMLARVPGLKMIDLPESLLCCGSAGTYNLVQPEMADRLGRRKVENILRTGASAVLAANAGCMLQIAAELRKAGAQLPVLHPMELLDLAYRELPWPPDSRATAGRTNGNTSPPRLIR